MNTKQKGRSPWRSLWMILVLDWVVIRGDATRPKRRHRELNTLPPAAGGVIGPQSQYQFETEAAPGTVPAFDWNISIAEFMYINKPTTVQGIYRLTSNYKIDDRSYDVELFKVDCETAPTGIEGDNLPLEFYDATENEIGTENLIELEWTYNQTKIEGSDLWTSNKTGGSAVFCIRVNNYLPENGEPFGREIHFLEIKYKIEVDSLTDFNQTMTIDRIDATEGGTEFIDYEEEIEVYQCDDSFMEISFPPPLTQGDYLQLCVETIEDSPFGVNSIKELDVSQDDTSLYPYIDGFIVSPLAFTTCKDSNTTGAVCRAKMQLLSTYFDEEEPSDLFANGTVKLDYVGRRLSVDVPLNQVKLGSRGHDGVEDARALMEEGGPSFGLNVELATENDSGSFQTFAIEAFMTIVAGASVFMVMVGY